MPTYTPLQWADLLARSVEKIQSLAELKGGEYAPGADRLGNFRKAGEEQGLPMETIWRVYAGKHWDAISTWCRDLREGRERPRLESISERIDDLIVYALLLKAMVEERERDHLQQARQTWDQQKEERVAENLLPFYEGPRGDLVGGKIIVLRSCAHEWRQMNKYTDICVRKDGCGGMRAHQRKPR